MKKIECEACGSNDLLKQGDYFVCQNCGCKYTVEDVRKMMIEGTVEVKGTVSVDTSVKEQGLIDLLEAACKNDDIDDTFERNVNKLVATNPKLWQGWFYKGVSEEIHFYDYPTTKTMNYFEKAHSVAAGEEKKKAEQAIIERVISLEITRTQHAMTYFSHYHLIKTKNFFNEVEKELGVLKTKYGCDDISIYETEIKMSQIVYQKMKELRGFYAQRFQPDNKDSCIGFAGDWINDNIAIVTMLSALLKDFPLSTQVVEDYYALIFAIIKHLLSAHYYSSTLDGYDDEGPILSKKETEEYKAVWEALKAAKPALVARAVERDNKYHQTKNNLYWSSHKEEKEKLESQLNGFDTKMAPYKEQIDELDDDIAQQKSLLTKPLKEEMQATELKQEADAAQKAFKKIGLFDKNRKAAKEEWQKKLDLYEAAQKSANDVRKAFDIRINSNIKELEAEKAEIVKVLNGIEKDYASIKEELTKNR